MKKFNSIFRVCFLVVLCGWGPVLWAQKPWQALAYPEAGNFKVPAIETFTLKNGISFYLVEDHELPLVNLTAVIRVGSCNDPEGKVGLASMLGELLREGGSTAYPAEQLNTLLENKAAELTSTVGLTRGQLSLNALREDFSELLPVVKDVLLNPAIPQDKLERVAKQTKSGIGRRNDDPDGIAVREFDVLIYGRKSPYARYSEYTDIESISREDLLAFHKAHYTGKNLWIGVVGDFSSSEMKKLLTDTFGGIPAGTPAQLNFSKVDYTYRQTINLVNKPDVTQSVVYMGHVGGKRQNPDYAALQLFNEILSGGFSGRLFQNVRTDLGLAYGVFGGYQMPALYEGQFFTGVMTKSSTTAEAIDAILSNVRRMQNEPVSQVELTAAKDRILNSLVFRYPSNASVLIERMTNTYNGLPPDIFDQYIAQVKQVTVADIQRVARQYIQPDKFHILVVGNKAEIGDQLSKYGSVNEIDITIPKPTGSDSPKVTGDAQAGKALFAKLTGALLSGNTLSGYVQKGNGTLYVQGNALPITLEKDVTLAQGFVSRLGVMGQKVEITYLNGQGTLVQGGQTAPLPDAMKPQMERERAFDLYRLSSTSADARFGLLGTEPFEGQPAVQLQVTIEGISAVFHLDPGTFLPLGKTYREFDPQQGAEKDTKEVYSDWREIQGIRFAFEEKSFSDGEPQSESIWSEITVR